MPKTSIVLAAALAAALTAGAIVRTDAVNATSVAAAAAPVVTVYKSPTCGCCAKWVDHMRAAGFEVEVHEMPDVTPLKDEVGVPAALRSCHTAVVSGYTLEGHVPADLVQKLLEEKPRNTAGLAVPGMPMGSPGMEGSRKDAYEVVAYTADGKTSVFAKR
jgi:hypothetical protein